MNDDEHSLFLTLRNGFVTYNVWNKMTTPVDYHKVPVT